MSDDVKDSDHAPSRYHEISRRVRELLRPVLRQVANEFEGGGDAVVEIMLALVEASAINARGVGADAEQYEREAVKIVRQVFAFPEKELRYEIPRDADGGTHRHAVFLDDMQSIAWHSNTKDGEELRVMASAEAQRRADIVERLTCVIDVDNAVLFTAAPEKAN